ncbi:MAG: hypothetical protein Rubg2KO_29510 [Rubricoccaceae bacterium]
MNTRPPSLGLVADRRIRQDAARKAPQLDVRGPIASSRRTPDELAKALDRPPGAGLTRRERRIKAILLKELETLNGKTNTWITSQERKHLFEGLDVAFIDREIEKMERQLRPRPWLTLSLALLALIYPVFYIGTSLGEPFGWKVAFDIFFGLAMPAALIFSWVMSRRAKQRRLWIYQALRELSDAEDEGRQLDESVRLSDVLIDRIVAAEDAAPLYRIRPS